MKFKPVTDHCDACHAEYLKVGPAGKFCPECSSFRLKVSQFYACRSRTIARGGKAWVGSGGQNEKGCHEQKYRRWFLMDVWSRQQGQCHDCWADLTPKQMLLHHIDHNRQNNVLSNFHGVCKRCHQIEHECWLAFQKGATTKREL